MSAYEETPACRATPAVYLPGGYPELYAQPLAANRAMHAALREHHAAGKPLLAECGGMMGLFETLTDREGRTHRVSGSLTASYVHCYFASNPVATARLFAP